MKFLDLFGFYELEGICTKFIIHELLKSILIKLLGAYFVNKPNNIATPIMLQDEGMKKTDIQTQGDARIQRLGSDRETTALWKVRVSYLQLNREVGLLHTADFRRQGC